ncbi:MAG: tRNA (adenosine(37)-N6)-threonylcarbamoyltransferase complex ATPase subunit type 1 TsaE [Clostridia bacterium]|nr:tRNA (adenosine(37)-N6)-threonylcarbamoyltransferase complex ATPase subunit type 1 TsaE [Clostridia bacterium]
MNTYTRETHTVEETEAAGYELAKLCLENGKGFVAMYGDLGAGKTAFVRGMARLAAPGSAVTSPTYSIVNEYTPAGGKSPTLFHFDMYRVSDWDDLDSIDFDSYFKRGALIVTEWSENIGFALPARHVRVDIEKLGELTRRISVKEVELT